jgi:HD-GYP domain-containing protein (c-di-GMP phosphodiesterase class II)
MVKEHPAYSLAILERAPCFAPIAALAANHHERIDGTGYPRGLGDAELDLPMRVLAVADVYEALTADRPYRGPLPVEKALDIVSWEVPGRLDRRVFAALESHLGRSTDPLAPGVLTVAEPAPRPAPPATAPRAARPSGG